MSDDRLVAGCLCICEADARWVDQYLAEAERLRLPFTVYFDRCSNTLKQKIIRHPLCVAHKSQNDPAKEYEENYREQPHRLAANLGYKLAVMWDADEIWEKDAKSKMEEMALRKDAWCFYMHWRNAWGDLDHVRMDNPSNPYRIKAHRLDAGVIWRWVGQLTVDPYPYKDWHPIDISVSNSTLVCINCGMMTHELRLQHKERWDRNLARCSPTGKNPYDYWQYLLDYDNHPPVIEKRQDLL